MSVAAQFEANASEDLSSPFYFNASHWRAMDGIVEGVKDREGIMVLTGPTGSGKTMLMRAISDNLGEGATPLFLQYASLNFREFVNFLHNSLNVGDEILEASNKAVALKKFLYAQAERKETAVVFVDEAQNLEPDVLRMLPKLACFDQLDDGTNVGLQFMLTGGSELREVLEDSDFEEVRGAVARNYDLRFFTREELKYFLEKRLAPLERMTPEPITDDAIDAVGKYTGGSPRLIGMICSHAMLFAAENPGRSIDEAMIEEAAEALMIEPVENPFAHEDDDMAELSGPFSSAELRGDDETSGEHDVTEETAMEDDMPIAAAAMEDFDDASVDVSNMVELDEVEGADNETPEMASVMDEMGMGLDVEQINDEVDEEGLEDDEFEAAVSVGQSGSLLARMKSAVSRGGKRGQPTRVIGAGRKGRNAERAAEPTEKRKLKTSVAGQREKHMKMGIFAAACSGLVFGVYMIRSDISKALARVTDTVSTSASSAMDSVSTAAADSADAMGEIGESIKVSSLDLTNQIPVAQEPTAAPAAPKSSGWGAKVEVVQPIGVKLPDTGVSLARGALDLVDSALEAGATMAPDSVQGAFREATKDVNSLRKTVTANGATTEEQLAHAAEMVAEGDSFFKRQLYIAPRGGNAYDAYRAALDIDPKNENALRGIENLRAFYSKKADAARGLKQWDRANRHFETALTISKRKPVR